MKKLIKILVLLLVPALGMAQKSRPDSLKQAFKNAPNDSIRYLRLYDLSDYYSEANRDSSLYYGKLAINLAKKNGHILDEAWALDGSGYVLMHLDKFPESLEYLQRALKLMENPESEQNTWNHVGKLSNHQIRIFLIGSIHHDMGHLMGATNNIEQQIAEYRETQKLATEAGDQGLQSLVNMNLGRTYEKLDRLDSALIFEQNAEKISKKSGFTKYLGLVYTNMGRIFFKMGEIDQGLKYYHLAINTGFEQKNFSNIAAAYNELARHYLEIKQKDSSLYFAKKTLGILNLMQSQQDRDKAYDNLYKSYQLNGKIDSAYKYQGLALTAKDSIFNSTLKNLADFQKLSFSAQLHAQELEKEKAATQTRIRTYVLLAAIAVFMLIAGIFYRNNRQKQKINNLLFQQNEEILQQKEEIESQRDDLEKTLSDLKATQTQLVQSEKMASLGELTAGIAHEIQNPLNFVNNFSEVNLEMLKELQAENLKPKAEQDEQTVNELINDLIANEEKINHHGRRADSIVKGMLEHSRSATGQKEPTDINLLADEFLRLSYHGLRAKDKSFNAEVITNLEAGLPKVNAIPQDIGRVLLNLFNNAFYAVNQKQKNLGGDYKPEVSVNTSTEKGQVLIKVKDNGIGIPDTIKEKIMQPFFTTKPTGEGTGLGLSLTYDMVVKGHGGSIQVNSVEGEGTEFIISIPIS